MGRPTILNVSEAGLKPDGLTLDGALAVELAEIKAQFMDVETGLIDYPSIRGSQAFERYRSLAAGLREFDPLSLQGDSQKKAFWINVYNAAVVHGVIELGIRRSVKEHRGFFKKVAYEVGGYILSLHEMEHGILRSNRRPPSGIRRPFYKGDNRLALCVEELDPRIHFALVCGARSCPPIGFYDPRKVEDQLELAASSFVNSEQVQVFPERQEVLLSRIFKWYKVDFGGTNSSIIETLIRYMDEGKHKEYLRDRGRSARIRYRPYDWALNAA